MNHSFDNDGVFSQCLGLKILDIPYYHSCFNLSNPETAAQCEIEFPCEVRQYLYSMSTFITVTRGFLSYGTITIIALGLFLNSLSFYTFASSGLSKNGSGIYLMSLAVCDCGNLIFNYGVGVARGQVIRFNQYFMDDEWLCRLHAVCVEVFQLISAWIVVTFTVERCIAIWYPMVMRNCSRTKRAKIVLTTLCTILTLFSLPKLFIKGFEGDSVYGYPACTSKRYRWQGVAYVRVAFQTWIPTIMVFVFNLLMFCKLQRVKTVRKQLTKHRRSGPRSQSGDPARKKSFINRPSRTAPMLIAVSLTYLILVFPVGIVQTVELVWDIHHKPPIYTGMENDGGLAKQNYIEWKTTKLLLKNIRSFCFGFYQINFAINFFLYFAAGLQFRLHLQHKLKEISYGLCGNGPNSNPRCRFNNTSMTMSTSIPQGSRRSNQDNQSTNIGNKNTRTAAKSNIQRIDEIPMEELKNQGGSKSGGNLNREPNGLEQSEKQKKLIAEIQKTVKDKKKAKDERFNANIARMMAFYAMEDYFDSSSSSSSSSSSEECERNNIPGVSKSANQSHSSNPSRVSPPSHWSPPSRHSPPSHHHHRNSYSPPSHHRHHRHSPPSHHHRHSPPSHHHHHSAPSPPSHHCSPPSPPSCNYSPPSAPSPPPHSP